MTKLKPTILTTCILAAASATLAMGSAMAGTAPATKQLSPEEQAANLHGHGKKPLSCDMSKLTIRNKGKDIVLEVAELINLDARGRIHPEARKMFRYKVYQMTELLKDYPGSKKVTFIPCDDETSLDVDVEEIMKDPYNYVLSLNNRGRARLATYKQTHKRARYHTTVKNITRIEIK